MGFYHRLLIYLLVPVLIFLAATVFLYQFYLSYIENYTQNQYVGSLNVVAKEMDDNYYQIMQTSMLLAGSPDFMDILYANSPIAPEGNYKYTSSMNLLDSFRVTNQSIYNIYLFQKSNGLILSSDGTYSPSEFFENTCYSDIYNERFFQQLNFSGSYYNIYSTSDIFDRYTDTHTAVIPFVMFGISGLNISSSNLLVVNISEQSMQNMLDRSRLTAHSRLFILDQGHNIVSQSSGATRLSGKLIGDIFSRSKNRNCAFFSMIVGNQKNLVISFRPKSTLFKTGYQYVALVPYTDLKKNSGTLSLVTSGVLLFSLLLGIGLAYVMRKRLYHPIQSLITLFRNENETENASRGEFDFLNTQIHHIMLNNQNLKKDLSIALPYVCEQYLLKLLTDNQNTLEKECLEFLTKYNFSFRYPNYCIAICSFDFTRRFFEGFSADEQSQIIIKLDTVMKSLLPDSVDSFALNLEKYSVCMIINLPDGDYEPVITDCFIKAEEIFRYDKGLVSVRTGIGRVYPNISGMNRSYQEALSVFATLSEMSNEKVKMFHPFRPGASYHYTLDDMNKLFFYLMSGNRENFSELLDRILQRNSSVSEESLKGLYIQLYNTAAHVLTEKGLNEKDVMGDQYINIIPSIQAMSLRAVSDYIMKLFNSVFALKNEARKIDMDEVKAYIDQNYGSAIYLELLSEKFGVPPKSLSKMLKDYLGVPFMQYLSRLRVTKAKEMLASTKDSIDAIARESGFNSRNTFIRMFEKMEGVTPSEYRRTKRK